MTAKMISMNTTRMQRGFTLIELLVVIAIIGLLSSVVLASLNTAREKSRDARRISDLRQIQTALELYYDDQTPGGYPDTVAALVTSNYLPSEPKDPRTDAIYLYDNVTNAGAACTGAGCTNYGLGSTLENSAHAALSGDIDTIIGSVPCSTASVYCVRP